MGWTPHRRKPFGTVVFSLFIIVLFNVGLSSNRLQGYDVCYIIRNNTSEKMNYDSDPALRSPWWVADDLDWALYGPILVRGMRVGDDIPLTKLVNVAGMRLFSHDDPERDRVKWIGRTPAGRLALKCLDGSPFDGEPCGGLPARPWKEWPDSAFHRRHVEYLKGVAVVVPADPGDVTGVARYSAVLKDIEPPGARSIFDLRWTNEHAFPVDAQFTLLGVGAFIDVLRSLGDISAKGWRILHGDVKNCYHQMPIGLGLSLACCLRLGDAAFRPTVVPMGFGKACFSAQTLMWEVLLHKGPEGDLGVPEELKNMTHVPGHIMLRGGGVIVLVYDSILLIAPKATVDEFEKRIKRNTAEINVVMKYITVEGATADFVFCGLRLIQDRNGLSWTLPAAKVAEWKLVVGNTLECTPRSIFALAGMLRFAAPILGWERQRLGRVSKLQSSLGNVSDWKKPCDGNGPREGLERMREMIMALPEDDSQKQHMKSHIPKRGREEPMFFAVDATLTHWSVCQMSQGQIVWQEQGIFVKEARIGVQESLVFAMAVRRAKIRDVTHAVIATDNTEAGRGFARGHGVDDIDGIVAGALYESAIIVADIGTDYNIADVGTRPDVSFSKENIALRTKRTWMCIQHAWRRFLGEKVVYSERTQEWK